MYTFLSVGGGVFLTWYSNWKEPKNKTSMLNTGAGGVGFDCLRPFQKSDT